MKNPEQPSEPTIRKQAKCLLVVTHSPVRQPNGRVKRQSRHFFTPKKNYNYLVEFAKAFAADLYLVQAKYVTVLPLEALTKALCDPTYDEKAEYEVINDMTPEANSSFGTPEDEYPSIQRRIRSQLLSGQAINVQDLKDKEGVSESTIRRHFTVVRNDLHAEGHTISQPQRGYYQIR